CGPLMTDKGRPDGAEPVCLFVVTSASWRLRGVKRPPSKEATESSHKGALPANAFGVIETRAACAFRASDSRLIDRLRRNPERSHACPRMGLLTEAALLRSS